MNGLFARVNRFAVGQEKVMKDLILSSRFARQSVHAYYLQVAPSPLINTEVQI